MNVMMYIIMEDARRCSHLDTFLPQQEQRMWQGNFSSPYVMFPQAPNKCPSCVHRGVTSTYIVKYIMTYILTYIVMYIMMYI